MKSLFLLAAELERFFQERRWRYCFIGGIANQRWGRPRTTVDVDVTLLTGLGTEETYAAPDILTHLRQLRRELS